MRNRTGKGTHWVIVNRVAFASSKGLNTNQAFALHKEMCRVQAFKGVTFVHPSFLPHAK